MGYLKSTGTVIIYFGLFLAVLTFLPGLPPDIEFSEYSIVRPRALDPKVGPKDRLHDIERLYVDKIVGPESFDSYNGQLYTGIYGGYVVRLEENQVVPIVKFGETCDGFWQEHKCGRPLGLKFDKYGDLYVADSYYGIFQINMATQEYKNIVNVSKPIEGKNPRLPNSLDITKNGDIYWTDSSTDFYLYDGMYSMLGNPSGRLIRYNAAKKKNEVLLRNLGFANGVKVSDDESFVIAAESGSSRIMKYHLKGPKAGQSEIFVEGLPGLPDNIHSDGHGGFLVSIVISNDPEHPQISQALIPHPYLRKMIIRLFSFMEAPFKLIQDIYPNTYAERLLYTIGSFQGVTCLDTISKSTVLRIDAAGNIIEGLTSNDNMFNHISSAFIHNDYLWFGSPWLSLAMRVPLKQAFPDFVSEKQPSHAKSGEQPMKAATSDAKSERAKRDTDSATAKPTAVPVTPKPTVAPKNAPVPKPNKSTKTGNSAESTKPVHDDVKKDVKSGAKSNSAKAETSDKTREDSTKSTKSGKNAQDQDASAKRKTQKPESEKLKPEANRPKNTNNK